MITINKDITITIDKGDVPVLSQICKMAEHYMAGEIGKMLCSYERIQICKFISIIFERVK